jgi:hypothetical protein
MGRIDLDPCSSELANKTVKADRIYTLENSMFRNSLVCESMHFNPPYSNPEPYIERMVFEFEQGNIKQVCGVLNVDCSTRWFAEIKKIATAYCFLCDRIQFDKANELQTEITETSGNSRCQFYFYAGGNTDKFLREFSTVGLCLAHNVKN